MTLAQRVGVLRPRDLAPLGIPRVYLQRLVNGGSLAKTGRGLYMVADAPITENHSLVEAARRTPKAVVCLLSALRFHNVTTENPCKIWIALPQGARRPSSKTPALHVVRFSGDAMTAGIEELRIEGVPVRVFGVGKTIADCFKFRNRIGINVAVEALRDAWRGKRATADDLWHYAKICRVLNVMRPYFDSLQ